MLRLTLIVLTLCITSELSKAATFQSGLLCYRQKDSSQNDVTYKIDCKDKKIFIASVTYENDFDNFCSNNSTSEINKRCYATNSAILRRDCNGRTECDVKLDENISFREADIDSNCDFDAQRLHISYECINDNMDDKSMTRFDICGPAVVQNKPEGFITSPNYPNPYNSRQYCQLRLKLSNNESERLEIYVIDMQMEKTSMWNANPTDYLEINNNGKLFAERAYELVFNESNNALLVFKTDNFFNKRGFLLYFKVVQIILPTTTTTTTTSATKTTTEVIESVLSSNETEYEDSIEDMNNENEDNAMISASRSIILTTISSEVEPKINSKAEELSSNKDEKNLNNLIIYILVGSVCILIVILISILVSRRFFGRNSEIKERMLSNNSSARTSTATSHTGSDGTQQYADDSMAHLLLNSSAINSTQLEAFYEDVTGTLPRDLPPLPPLPHQTSTKLLEMSLKSEKEFGYINDANRASFRNEYCYIHANNLNEKGEKIDAAQPDKAPQNIYITNTALKAANEISEPIKEETSDDIAIEKAKLQQNSNEAENNYYVVPSNMPVAN